jgi:hypothetical protein
MTNFKEFTSMNCLAMYPSSTENLFRKKMLIEKLATAMKNK